MASKSEQRKLLSVWNEIEEVSVSSKCGKNKNVKKRLKRALNILDDMIDEDIFQE